MAKSDDDEMSSINLTEAGKEAGRELGAEITVDNELSRINWGEVGKEAGHKSGVELTASDDEWIISIVEEKTNASSFKLLQKVPRELREKEQNKGFFFPRFISIGPYHHGNPKLKEVEKLKTIAVRSFIADTNVEPREIYNKMFEVVSDARTATLRAQETPMTT